EAPASGSTPSAAEPAGDPADWPRDFVATPGSGPALYLSESPEAPGIGYVTEGTAIRIGSLPQNGRIKVRIDGPMKVRGWLVASRLGLRVRQGGRVPETPISLAPGDYVEYVGPGESGIARVRARTELGREGLNGPSFPGIFPLDRLTTDAVAPEAPTGTAARLPAGQPVELYVTPEQVGATLPAADPGLIVDLARDRGRWKGVRIGVGPRLVGYVNVELSEADALPSRQPPATAAEGEPPMRLRVDEDRPLWRVQAGTRVRYGDTVIAIMESQGWAREMERFEDDNEVDVFIAADDGVALRGTVPASALVAAEGS
ncbi:MAG: hypothetical protein AAF645_20255, partial [Myxococcota bacterium]